MHGRLESIEHWRQSAERAKFKLGDFRATAVCVRLTLVSTDWRTPVVRHIANMHVQVQFAKSDAAPRGAPGWLIRVYDREFRFWDRFSILLLSTEPFWMSPLRNFAESFMRGREFFCASQLPLWTCFRLLPFSVFRNFSLWVKIKFVSYIVPERIRLALTP